MRSRRDRSVQEEDCPPMELCLPDLRWILLFCAQTDQLTSHLPASLKWPDMEYTRQNTIFQALESEGTYPSITLYNKALFEERKNWTKQKFCLYFRTSGGLPVSEAKQQIIKIRIRPGNTWPSMPIPLISFMQTFFESLIRYGVSWVFIVTPAPKSGHPSHRVAHIRGHRLWKPRSRGVLEDTWNTWLAPLKKGSKYRQKRKS